MPPGRCCRTSTSRAARAERADVVSGPARARGRSPRRGRAGRPSAASTGTGVSARRPRRRRGPGRAAPGRRAGRREARRTTRAAEARPATVGRATTSDLVAARDHLVDHRVARSAAGRRRPCRARAGRPTTTSRTANGWSDARPTGVPGQHPQPSPSGAALSRNDIAPSRPVVWQQLVPAHPGPAPPCRAPGRGRGRSGRRRPRRRAAGAAATWPMAAANMVAPAPPDATDHTDRPGATRSLVTEVGQQLDDPLAGLGQPGDVLGAEGQRDLHRRRRRGPRGHDVDPLAAQRAQRGELGRHVVADEHQRSRRPPGQAAEAVGCDDRASRPRRRARRSSSSSRVSSRVMISGAFMPAPCRGRPRRGSGGDDEAVDRPPRRRVCGR